MKNINRLFKKYIEFCEFQKKLDPKTIKAYKIDIKQFIEFIKNNNTYKKNIVSYINILNEKYKQKTVKRKIACLKAFFRYLKCEEYILNDPFEKIILKTNEDYILPNILSINDIKKILSCAYKNLKLNNKEKNKVLRDIAVLELLFSTGLRISELCSAKIENINLHEKYIRILGKGAKERIIYISNDAVIKILKEYRKVSSCIDTKNNYFFINRLNNRLSEQSVRFMIKKYANLAGIEKNITPHMFRHTLATLLLEEDVDIRYIQEILGHSSIKTTQIYTHVSRSKQKSILILKHPRNKIKI